MKMPQKIIPKTSENNYISGWEALNIPNEKGDVADWHPRTYLFSNNPSEEIELYNTINFFGNKGIKKRMIYYPEKQEVYIASFSRAIADLLVTMKDYQVPSLYGCRKDFLNEKESGELYNYLKPLDSNPRIKEFLKYEFTKKYFGVE